MRTAGDRGPLSNLKSGEDVPVPPTLAQSTALINATAMSARNYRGDGWTVAVLDTGVDAMHPFLRGRVVSQACYSSTLGSFQSLCPGGVSSSTAPGSAQSCSGYSGCDHGTHVAGIAAGAGSAFNGVAPDAGIIATNALGLWVMEGSALRDTPPFSPNVADPGRQLVATTDIDGDGDGNSDLVFQDIVAGVLEAWLMAPANVRSSVQPVLDPS